MAGRAAELERDVPFAFSGADAPTCMPLDARTVSCAAVRRLELDAFWREVDGRA